MRARTSLVKSLRRVVLDIFSLALMGGAGPASADIISLNAMFPIVDCTTPPNPGTTGSEFGNPSGCWTLLNSNSDGTFGGAATGSQFTNPGEIGLNGSDANLVNNNGDPLLFSTLTQYTTVITDTTNGITLGLDGITLSGDLTFNWSYSTQDAGSFYDPAGYFLCPAMQNGFPDSFCGIHQLTSDIDAFNPVDPSNPPLPPFAESGQVTVTLSPQDVFGLYIVTLDNQFGAGRIIFSDPTQTGGPPDGAVTPEPASLFLTAGGLLAICCARWRARAC